MTQLRPIGGISRPLCWYLIGYAYVPIRTKPTAWIGFLSESQDDLSILDRIVSIWNIGAYLISLQTGGGQGIWPCPPVFFFSFYCCRSTLFAFFAIFLLGGHATADVSLSLVGIQYFLDLPVELGINGSEAFRDIFMYGRY